MHKKGRWELATWYDVDCARRDYVCKVLEWIDDLRYRIEDECNATCANTEQSKTNDKRQRKKRTPDVLAKVMQNAPRIPTESGIEANEPEEQNITTDRNDLEPGSQRLRTALSPVSLMTF